MKGNWAGAPGGLCPGGGREAIRKRERDKAYTLKKQKSPFKFFFKNYAKFLFLKENNEKLYNPSNETCKKLASSEACFSISFKVKGWPIPVIGISRFPLSFR